MRTARILLLICLCCNHALGQAPSSASLWRVAAASLTVPPALEAGPAGLSWNPAAHLEESALSAAVTIVQTSDVVGVSGMLAGLSHAVGRSGRLGISVGRVDVSDLVRTTSSPTSVGSIPVYEQFLGIVGQYQTGRLVVGGLARVHDERFDLQREQGFTVDVGLRFRASRRLVLAAATHFLPIEMSNSEPTDYYAAAEYSAVPNLQVGRVAAQVLVRYGATYRSSERLEHMLGGGLRFGRYFRLDASLVRESGYQSAGWRPAVAVSVRIGRYQLGVARSNGLNDLGATYRIGLDATLFR